MTLSTVLFVTLGHAFWDGSLDHSFTSWGFRDTEDGSMPAPAPLFDSNEEMILDQESRSPDESNSLEDILTGEDLQTLHECMYDSDFEMELELEGDDGDVDDLVMSESLESESESWEDVEDDDLMRRLDGFGDFFDGVDDPRMHRDFFDKHFDPTVHKDFDYKDHREDFYDKHYDPKIHFEYEGKYNDFYDKHYDHEIHTGFNNFHKDFFDKHYDPTVHKDYKFDDHKDFHTLPPRHFGHKKYKKIFLKHKCFTKKIFITKCDTKHRHRSCPHGFKLIKRKSFGCCNSFRDCFGHKKVCKSFGHGFHDDCGDYIKEHARKFHFKKHGKVCIDGKVWWWLRTHSHQVFSGEYKHGRVPCY